MKIPKAPANMTQAQYRKWLKNYIAELQAYITPDTCEEGSKELRAAISKMRDILSELDRRARFNG